MEKFNLLKMQKKAQMGGAGKQIGILIGAVVLIVLIANLAPDVLSSLFSINTTDTGIPTWVPTVFGILGVVVFIFILWKLVDK